MAAAFGVAGEASDGLKMLFRRFWTRLIIEADLSKLDARTAFTNTISAPCHNVGSLGGGIEDEAGVDKVVPLLAVARE